jgi:hypothetical protein
MPYNQETINRDLAEHNTSDSEFQKKVVELCKRFVKQSADAMSTFYDTWDNNDVVYRGYRMPDKNDKDANKDGEPPKIIVPVTYAQLQTAVSFLFATYSQKPVLYEILGGGPEDQNGTMAFETDIDYQMRRQQMMFKLYNALVDAFKYGFCVMKCDWHEQYCKMRGQVQVPELNILGRLGQMFGIQPQAPSFRMEEQVIDVLEYQGNRITNVSPYNFFPDPSVTIANFQQGKFVAHDEETSLTAVKKEEGQAYFGTDKIPASIPPDDTKHRNRRTGRIFGDAGMGISPLTPGAGSNAKDGSSIDACVLLEVEMVLIPKEASKLFGMDLGKEDYPMKFLAVIANDNKLIRFEASGNLHNQFSYAIGEYSPDHNAFYNPGLSETIYELQNIITFFLNSHIVNVRKIIQNRFVVDETKINLNDIKTNSMFIRLTQSGVPIDKVLKQLEAYDVTQNHVKDMDVLLQMVQTVTGINENALGQYSSGRRSATEARSVNAGAAARLKMHGQLLWMQCFDPLGRQIIANTRQSRTKEAYEMIVGALALKAPFEEVIYANPTKIAGGYDFSSYDATLPSDKQFQASQLQEIFSILVQNPNTIQLLGKDPTKLLSHITQLLGIKNIEDYNLDNPAIPPLQAPQAQVVPDQQAGDMAASGAQPVDMMGQNLLNGLGGGQPQPQQ